MKVYSQEKNQTKWQMIGGDLPEQAWGSQGQAEQSRAEPGSQSKPASWFEVQQKGLERGAVRQREHSKAKPHQIIEKMRAHMAYQ